GGCCRGGSHTTAVCGTAASMAAIVCASTPCRPGSTSTTMPSVPTSRRPPSGQLSIAAQARYRTVAALSEPSLTRTVRLTPSSPTTSAGPSLRTESNRRPVTAYVELVGASVYPAQSALCPPGTCIRAVPAASSATACR